MNRVATRQSAAALLAAFALLAPITAAAEDTPATSPDNTMDLLVVDQSTKAPIPDMAILTAGGQRPRFNGKTGPDGHVHIPLPKSDNYPYFNIAIRGPGYVFKRLRWFPGSAPMNGTPPATRTFEMEPVATIQGHVVDTKGDPIPHASVLLVFDKDYTDPHEQLDIGGSEGYTLIKADAAGHFIFNAAPADCKAIEVGASGEHHIALLVAPFTPESNLRDGTAVITLSPGVSVAGTVVDENEKPIPKAVVQVEDPTFHGYPPPTVKTDAAGKFAFAFKAGDKVTLSVYMKGFPAARQEVAVGNDDQQITVKLSHTEQPVPAP